MIWRETAEDADFSARGPGIATGMRGNKKRRGGARGLRHVAREEGRNGRHEKENRAAAGKANRTNERLMHLK
jgi:hypothetical protein